MARLSGHSTRLAGTTEIISPVTEVRVAILIPTHALPPLSYRVPEHLRGHVRLGSAVAAPLSGYSRLGIVVGVEEPDEDRDLEDVREVFEDLALDAGLVRVCRWVCEVSAVPLANVLRTALPPGLDTRSYRILHPAPDWSWRRGSVVARGALRRALGPERLKVAEEAARIELTPHCPPPASEEWTVAAPEVAPDFGRAHSQRKLFEELRAGDANGVRSGDLLAATGATRATLLRLERRGLVRFEKRPAVAAVHAASGGVKLENEDFISRDLDGFLEGAEARFWRLPTVDHPAVAVAVARSAVERGEQALILAPEIEGVERLKDVLLESLPEGCSVAAYHSDLGRGRTAVYEAGRAGEVDVIVGTRAAALLPLPRLGVICVVDEPNEAFRAKPGYEGLPLHARDIALKRGGNGGASVVLLSPTPTLRLYGSGVAELPARLASSWPAVRLVDMRGTGAVFSATFLDACRSAVENGGRVGVLVNRIGPGVSVSCNRCGAVRSCPVCDLPLALHGTGRLAALICARCGHREAASENCPQCGSLRLSVTGLAAGKVRAELRAALEVPVGLLTAGEKSEADAPVVVGTTRLVQNLEWALVCVPDADSLILGSSIGSVERGFRTLYRAAESARIRLVVQTRNPEHYALQAALRSDYRGFAAAELPKLRALGYPPYAHLAEVVISGPGNAVRDAVESRLRPKLPLGVRMSALVPAGSDRSSAWRVLLRASERREVARAATMAARLGGRQANGLKVLVDVDPEEV